MAEINNEYVDPAIAFGYPQCCIDECNEYFGENSKNSEDRAPRKLNGTGYIPCASCNASKTPDELIEAINKKRTYPLPFPMSFDGLIILPKNLETEVLAEYEKILKRDYLDYIEKYKECYSEINAIRILLQDMYIIGRPFELLEDIEFYD